MRLPASGVGVGLRSLHYDDFLRDRPEVDWLEVHAENYFGRGGIHHQALRAIAEHYPIAVHGVALSLASGDGIDGDHLDRLASLVDDVGGCAVSEHLAWSRFGGRYFNDLLPLPLTEETLDVLSQNVERAQARFRQPLLIENPAGYCAFEESRIPEAEFLANLVRRTGCGLLLDVNNLYVTAANLGIDPLGYLAALPSDAIAELHLAGHEPSHGPGASLLIDTHAQPVSAGVWDLYATVVARIGPRPTLVEWDTNLPPAGVLVAEAHRAASILGRRTPDHAMG